MNYLSFRSKVVVGCSCYGGVTGGCYTLVPNTEALARAAYLSRGVIQTIMQGTPLSRLVLVSLTGAASNQYL